MSSSRLIKATAKLNQVVIIPNYIEPLKATSVDSKFDHHGYLLDPVPNFNFRDFIEELLNNAHEPEKLPLEELVQQYLPAQLYAAFMAIYAINDEKNNERNESRKNCLQKYFSAMPLVELVQLGDQQIELSTHYSKQQQLDSFRKSQRITTSRTISTRLFSQSMKNESRFFQILNATQQLLEALSTRDNIATTPIDIDIIRKLFSYMIRSTLSEKLMNHAKAGFGLVQSLALLKPKQFDGLKQQITETLDSNISVDLYNKFINISDEHYSTVWFTEQQAKELADLIKPDKPRKYILTQSINSRVSPLIKLQHGVEIWQLLLQYPIVIIIEAVKNLYAINPSKFCNYFSVLNPNRLGMIEITNNSICLINQFIFQYKNDNSIRLYEHYITLDIFFIYCQKNNKLDLFFQQLVLSEVFKFSFPDSNIQIKDLRNVEIYADYKARKVNFDWEVKISESIKALIHSGISTEYIRHIYCNQFTVSYFDLLMKRESSSDKISWLKSELDTLPFIDNFENNEEIKNTINNLLSLPKPDYLKIAKLINKLTLDNCLSDSILDELGIKKSTVKDQIKKSHDFIILINYRELARNQVGFLMANDKGYDQEILAQSISTISQFGLCYEDIINEITIGIDHTQAYLFKIKHTITEELSHYFNSQAKKDLDKIIKKILSVQLDELQSNTVVTEILYSDPSSIRNPGSYQQQVDDTQSFEASKLDLFTLQKNIFNFIMQYYQLGLNEFLNLLDQYDNEKIGLDENFELVSATLVSIIDYQFDQINSIKNSENSCVSDKLADLGIYTVDQFDYLVQILRVQSIYLTLQTNNYLLSRSIIYKLQYLSLKQIEEWLRTNSNYFGQDNDSDAELTKLLEIFSQQQFDDYCQRNEFIRKFNQPSVYNSETLPFSYRLPSSQLLGKADVNEPYEQMMYGLNQYKSDAQAKNELYTGLVELRPEVATQLEELIYFKRIHNRLFEELKDVTIGDAKDYNSENYYIKYYLVSFQPVFFNCFTDCLSSIYKKFDGITKKNSSVDLQLDKLYGKMVTWKLFEAIQQYISDKKQGMFALPENTQSMRKRFTSMFSPSNTAQDTPEIVKIVNRYYYFYEIFYQPYFEKIKTVIGSFDDNAFEYIANISTPNIFDFKLFITYLSKTTDTPNFEEKINLLADCIQYSSNLSSSMTMNDAYVADLLIDEFLSKLFYNNTIDRNKISYLFNNKILSDLLFDNIFKPFITTCDHGITYSKFSDLIIALQQQPEVYEGFVISLKLPDNIIHTHCDNSKLMNNNTIINLYKIRCHQLLVKFGIKSTIHDSIIANTSLLDKLANINFYNEHIDKVLACLSGCINHDYSYLAKIMPILIDELSTRFSSYYPVLNYPDYNIQLNDINEYTKKTKVVYDKIIRLFPGYDQNFLHALAIFIRKDSLDIANLTEIYVIEKMVQLVFFCSDGLNLQLQAQELLYYAKDNLSAKSSEQNYLKSVTSLIDKKLFANNVLGYFAQILYCLLEKSTQDFRVKYIAHFIDLSIGSSEFYTEQQQLMKYNQYHLDQTIEVYVDQVRIMLDKVINPMNSSTSLVGIFPDIDDSTPNLTEHVVNNHKHKFIK